MKAKRPPPTPLDRAFRLLAVRDRTERELRTRLARAEVSAADIEAVITRLRELGYLDDARFASARARGLVATRGLGPRAVAQKLAQAGVARELAQRAIGDAFEGQDEATLARAALAKKHPQAFGSRDPKLRARALRFLIGRGFSPSVAARVLDLELPDDG